MMLLSQKAVHEQNDASPGSPSKAPAHSPVKGVMAALSKHRVSQEPLSSLAKHGKKIAGLDMPEKIEDVPFRRQDRRILNARKKRIIAKRIICFGIGIAAILLMMGIALLTIYFLYNNGTRSHAGFYIVVFFIIDIESTITLIFLPCFNFQMMAFGSSIPS